MPFGPTLTNATCSMTSRDCPSRLRRKRQFRRFRRPTCMRCESRTSKSVARENQPSKRRAISSRPERSSGPGGKSIRACASGAKDSANRPKSRAHRADRKASSADSCMRPKVAAARSTEHQPFGPFFAIAYLNLRLSWGVSLCISRRRAPGQPRQSKAGHPERPQQFTRSRGQAWK